MTAPSFTMQLCTALDRRRPRHGLNQSTHPLKRGRSGAKRGFSSRRFCCPVVLMPIVYRPSAPTSDFRLQTSDLRLPPQHQRCPSVITVPGKPPSPSPLRFPISALLPPSRPSTRDALLPSQCRANLIPPACQSPFTRTAYLVPVRRSFCKGGSSIDKGQRSRIPYPASRIDKARDKEGRQRSSCPIVLWSYGPVVPWSRSPVAP